jgi:hypothetical protein
METRRNTMPATFQLSQSLPLLIAAGLFSGQALGAGKVVFSSTPIDLKNPAAQTASFKAGDPIYGAVVLSASIKSLCGTNTSVNATKEALELNYYVDNKYKDTGFLTARGPFFAEATVFPLDVAPEPARMTAYREPNLEYRKFGQSRDGAMTFSEALGGLTAGAHTFKIEVLACSRPIASGSFRIEGASFNHYAQLVPALRSEETKSVGMSTPKRNDAVLSAAMLKAMQASSSEAWKDPIIRIVILDPDWFIERHPISGAILFRYIRAEVAVKGRDGNCSFYKLCTFKQDYVGGKFGATRYDGHGDRQALPCENVGK